MKGVRERDPSSDTSVGRERELREITGELAVTAAGRGRLVLISGEPGIGKTRLADRIGAIAARSGFRTLWGRPWETEGAPTFWPWVQVIRTLADAATPAELAAQLGNGAPYLAQLVPEIAQKVTNMPALATSPESEHARFYLFDALTRFLKRSAQARPLVLVFDDIHWADRPSLLLLEFLARELHDARILVIAIYREAEARQAVAANEALGTLVREAKQIPLRGLGEADVALLVERVGGPSFDAKLVASIHRATDGNPFFVDEVVRLLVAEGGSPDGALPIPEGVRAALRRRLRALPAECAELLLTASLLGRDFDIEALQGAAKRSAEEVLALLTTGARAGWITRDSATTGRYTFVHALVRETLYDDVDPLERQRRHLEVGEALEEVYGSERDSHAAELAYHFSAAGAKRTEKALGYSRTAGERAMAMLAYEEAAEHFGRACELAASAKLDDAARCDLLLELAHALGSAGGERTAAEGAAVRAAEVARRIGDPERLSRAALAFHARSAAFFTGTTNERHVELLEEALRGLPRRDSVLRALVMARLATELPFDVSQRIVELSGEALAIARRLGDRSALASVLSARLFSLWGATATPNAWRLPQRRSGSRRNRATWSSRSSRDGCAPWRWSWRATSRRPTPRSRRTPGRPRTSGNPIT